MNTKLTLVHFIRNVRSVRAGGHRHVTRLPVDEPLACKNWTITYCRTILETVK